MKTVILAFLMLFSGQLFAQTGSQIITGRYFLNGVMEVGSGFRFNADSTFDFFFSYGAMDRFGKGTFEQRGDSLILHSAPKPERDFILTSEKTTDDDRVTIRVTDQNPMVLPFILCNLETPDSVLERQSDQEGYIVFASKWPVKSISLLHRLWPDRASTFQISDPAHNSFEFTIDPQIVEVEFNGMVLHITGDALEGPHPLLEPGKIYQFLKGD